MDKRDKHKCGSMLERSSCISVCGSFGGCVPPRVVISTWSSVTVIMARLCSSLLFCTDEDEITCW